MGRLVGYGRTSTSDQIAGLEAQIRDLQEAGCSVIYSEQISSVAEREQLRLALADIGPGDTLMVCKPDRLARSTLSLLEIVRDLDARGSHLMILSMGGQRLDTASPTSRLILTILAGVATFERAIMLERQREGIAKARIDGKYKGRPRDRAPGVIDSVYEMSDKKIPWVQIAAKVGLSERTIARIIKDRQSNGFGHIPSSVGRSDNDHFSVGNAAD